MPVWNFAWHATGAWTSKRASTHLTGRKTTAATANRSNTCACIPNCAIGSAKLPISTSSACNIPYLLYNVSDIKLLGTEGERHQGWGAGVGVSYGYSFLLSKHWNLEATVGVGYLYLESEKYPCTNCGRRQGYEKKHYFGPTQAAINLIYQF